MRVCVREFVWGYMWVRIGIYYYILCAVRCVSIQPRWHNNVTRTCEFCENYLLVYSCYIYVSNGAQANDLSTVRQWRFQDQDKGGVRRLLSPILCPQRPNVVSPEQIFINNNYYGLYARACILYALCTWQYQISGIALGSRKWKEKVPFSKISMYLPTHPLACFLCDFVS